MKSFSPIPFLVLFLSFGPLSAHAATETVLYSFQGGSDGANPQASLIDIQGTLYGTTQFGGTGGGADACKSSCGTVFALDLNTGAETVLHSFGNGSDGFYPWAGLLDVQGTLYGTTYQGGSYQGVDCAYVGCGIVFSLAPSTGAETVLYAFIGYPSDGSWSTAGLTKLGSSLYGTTGGGGKKTNGCPNGCGAVFSLDIKTGAEHVRHFFNNYSKDAYEPEAELTNVNGVLYGTTYGGGRNDQGTVFSFDPETPASIEPSDTRLSPPILTLRL